MREIHRPEAWRAAHASLVRKAAGMDRWAALYALGARQHGVVSAADARSCGVPESTLRHRASREQWAHPYRGVWVLPGADSAMTDDVAALLACGSSAVLARRSAAFVWEFRKAPPSRPEVLVPHGGGRPRHPGVVVLRAANLIEADIAEHAGLRVTAPARTLADLARVTSSRGLLSLVVQARQRGLVEVGDLGAQATRMRGAPGIQRFREAVELACGERVDSILEHDVRRGLRLAGLPSPAPEPVWLGSGPGRVQIDIAWPDIRVGIEVDGFAYHHTAEDLARDHRKANVAAAAGWVLLRVGYLRWRDDRVGFLGEVRRVLEAPDGSVAAAIGRK